MEQIQELLLSILLAGVLSPYVVFGRLAAAALLGIIIGLIYLATYRGIYFHFSFFLSQIILTIVSAIVIMVIGDNVARAFGLMGALNLIRFSSRIQDPKDVVLLFYSVGIGMACGSGSFIIAIAGVFFVSLILFALKYIHFSKSELCRFNLDLKLTENDSFHDVRKQIENILREENIDFSLVSLEFKKKLRYRIYKNSEFSAEKGELIVKNLNGRIKSFEIQNLF